MYTDIVAFSGFVSMGVYVVARTVSLVEALVALKRLPLGAFVMVRWMSFLPHT